MNSDEKQPSRVTELDNAPVDYIEGYTKEDDKRFWQKFAFIFASFVGLGVGLAIGDIILWIARHSLFDLICANP